MTRQKPKRYIGVTGFMHRHEVQQLMNALDPMDHEKLSIMIGILVSSKTLLHEQNKWSNRYPSTDALGNIFIAHPACFNVVHFHSDYPNDFDLELIETWELIADDDLADVHGFQLNMCWPRPDLIEDVRESTDTDIILQIGQHAFEHIKHSPQRLAEKIKTEYADVIDYVLLDDSGGRGAYLVSAYLAPFLESLQQLDLPIGLGVAGGLFAENLHAIKPLLNICHDLSIDAEGRLRDGEDNLAIDTAIPYCVETQRMFSRYHG